MNRFVLSMIGPRQAQPRHRAIRFVCRPRTDASGQVEPKESPMRRANQQIRLTLATELGDPIDGGWWPTTSSIARELPGLINVLEKPLGHVVDISVNWSSLSGLANLDSLNWRGNSVVSIGCTRRQRVMTLTGSRATARLLVVPWRTSTALAVMLLRQAARLPIQAIHRDTDAFRVADGIVRAACAEDPSAATAAANSA
jgi:Family of unknown function (DUF5994)